MPIIRRRGSSVSIETRIRDGQLWDHSSRVFVSSTTISPVAHPKRQDQVRGQPSSLNRGHRGSFLRGETTEAWNCQLHPVQSYISTACLKGAAL